MSVAITPPPKAEVIAAALRAEHLGQPAVVTAAYAATVSARVAILATLNTETKTMEKLVEAHFGKHPNAEIYLSQPGLGTALGPGYLPSSATTNSVTPTPQPARTTPAPARSPASPARRSTC